MLFSAELIEELEKIDPQTRTVFIKILKFVEKAVGEVVKREDFLELRKELEILTKAVRELAEAQKKSEGRLVRLENTVASLTETVKKLTEEHKKMREQIGGISHTVGYILEDRAYKGLPGILKRDFGIESVDYLKREYIEISPGKYEEVNIVGRGKKDGEDVWIVGDCKTQLKKRDVDEFISTIQKIEKVMEGKKILITVVYQASPNVRKYVEEKGIRLYFSYEMPL